MKRNLVLTLCLTVILSLLGSSFGSVVLGNSKPTIVTTMYPLYEFTKAVVGDKAEVLLLVPAGAEPHDWEPTPRDLITIQNAQLVIYNGIGMEPWIDKVGASVLTGKKVIQAADYADLIQAKFDEAGAAVPAGTIDSHIWLDPVNAQAIVRAIALAVSEIDPASASQYDNNASWYNAQLAELHNEYSAVLSSAARKEIITSHTAFGYLANRYGLKQIAIMGLSPDAEPTPQRMTQIINHVKNNGIKYIFFESLVSPKLSEVIAKETGAQTLVLNPIEGLTDAELAQGDNYIITMRKNLQNLKYALDL